MGAANTGLMAPSKVKHPSKLTNLRMVKIRVSE